MNKLQSSISALLAGVLFGAGLTVSEMVNPNKVLAFLDISGNWDPSLALVMAAAVVISLLAYKCKSNMHKPFFSSSFQLPQVTKPDPSLISGAVLFGLGWGLVGLCPGPALASLWAADSNLYLFVASMLFGLVIGKSIKNTTVMGSSGTQQ